MSIFGPAQTEQTMTIPVNNLSSTGCAPYTPCGNKWAISIYENFIKVSAILRS